MPQIQRIGDIAEKLHEPVLQASAHASDVAVGDEQESRQDREQGDPAGKLCLPVTVSIKPVSTAAPPRRNAPRFLNLFQGSD
jgi:hypothetical protein